MSLQPNGLLADYQLSEGTGAVLHDSSPAGNNAAIDTVNSGASPKWNPAGQGLLWANGEYGWFNIPIQLSAIKSITILGKYTGTSTQVILASQANSGSLINWGFGPGAAFSRTVPRIDNPNGQVILSPTTYVGATQNASAACYFLQANNFAVTFSSPGGNDKVYYGATPQTCSQDTSAIGRTGTLRVGFPFNGLPTPAAYVGEIHRVIIYGVTPADADVTNNHAVCVAFGAANGGRVYNGPNPSTLKQVLVVGDSIQQTISNGVVLPQGTIFGAMVPGGKTVVTNVAIGGTVVGYSDQAPLFGYPVYAPAAPENIAYVGCGTNDLAGGTAPATVAASMQALINHYAAIGFKGVVLPILDRINLAPSVKASANSAYAALSYPTGWHFCPASAIPALTNDGANADLSVFTSDNVHPNQNGENLMAEAAYAAYYASAGTVPAAADVRLGSAVGSTTGTLHVPTVAQVLSGIAVDAATGTVVLPAATQVQSTVAFGPGSSTTGTYDPVTGQYTDPGVAHVQSGTTYQFNGTSLTGTCDPVTGRYTDPGASNVVSSHTYVFAGTTINGTFVAASVLAIDYTQVQAACVNALSSFGKSGYSLAASGLDAVQVEAGVNARQALSPILAACAGNVAGAGSGVVVIKGGNTATTRITAITDIDGNRSSVALTLPF